MSGLYADASKVSMAEFADRVLPGRPRAEVYAELLETIVKRIENGNSLYRYPPAAVAEARGLIAEREALSARVEADLKFTLELSKRRAA